MYADVEFASTTAPDNNLVYFVGVCSSMHVQSEEVPLLRVLRVRRWWRRRELLRAFVAERARHAAAVNASGSRGGCRLSPVRLLLLLLLLILLLGSGGGEVDCDGGGGGEVGDAQRAAALKAAVLTRDPSVSFALGAGWQAHAAARESLPFDGGAISFAAAADGGDGGCYSLTTTADVRLL